MIPVDYKNWGKKQWFLETKDERKTILEDQNTLSEIKASELLAPEEKIDITPQMGDLPH